MSDEASVQAMFPWREMSPEEFAARNAADILCFSLDERDYEDAAFDAWVKRLGAILRDWSRVDECRRAFLRPEEYARALARDQEEP